MMKAYFGLLLLLFLFCGVHETFCQNETWIQLSSLFGVAKPFRQGHSASMTTFGRMVSVSGLDNTLTGVVEVNRFNYLSNSQLQILPVDPDDDRQSRQLSAFGTWADRYHAQYGGLRGGATTNELIIFDMADGKWINNTVGFLSEPIFNIENHFTFLSDSVCGTVDNSTGSFYLFGGKSTILMLNFITKIDLLPPYEYHQINVSNALQPERRYGCALAYRANTLFLFAGIAGLGTPLQNVDRFNDLFSFDLTSKTWTEITATNAPAARGYMANVVLGDGQTWLIFGGADETVTPIAIFNNVFTLDLATPTAWTSVVLAGTPPSPRDRIVGVHLGWPGEDSVLIYGGADSNGGSINEFWKLQLVSTGSAPNPPPPAPSSGSVPNNNDFGDTNVVPTDVASSSSSSAPLVQPQDAAASALTSWLSLL